MLLPFLLFLTSLLPVHGETTVRFGSLSAPTDVRHRSLTDLPQNIIQSRNILLPSMRPQHIIGEQIEFELFNNEIVVGEITSTVFRTPTSASWFGVILKSSNVDDDQTGSSRFDGSFALSCVENACLATLTVESTMKEYSIVPSGFALEEDGSGIYALLEVDPVHDSRFSGEVHQQGSTGHHTELHKHQHGHVENADLSSRQPGNLGSSPFIVEDVTSSVDMDLILDVLVMYTPAALAQSQR